MPVHGASLLTDADHVGQRTLPDQSGPSVGMRVTHPPPSTPRPSTTTIVIPEPEVKIAPRVSSSHAPQVRVMPHAGVSDFYGAKRYLAGGDITSATDTSGSVSMKGKQTEDPRFLHFLQHLYQPSQAKSDSSSEEIGMSVVPIQSPEESDDEGDQDAADLAPTPVDAGPITRLFNASLRSKQRRKTHSTKGRKPSVTATPVDTPHTAQRRGSTGSISAEAKLHPVHLTVPGRKESDGKIGSTSMLTRLQSCRHTVLAPEKSGTARFHH